MQAELYEGYGYVLISPPHKNGERFDMMLYPDNDGKVVIPEEWLSKLFGSADPESPLKLYRNYVIDSRAWDR